VKANGVQAVQHVLNDLNFLNDVNHVMQRPIASDRKFSPLGRLINTYLGNVKQNDFNKFTVPVPLRHKSEIRISKSETNAETDKAKIGKIQNIESKGSWFGI
jgi:hypothetical protein